jgi:hypothetical protein
MINPPWAQVVAQPSWLQPKPQPTVTDDEMYICLDLDHMRVLYKHPRAAALSWIALIECPNVALLTFPISWRKGIEKLEDSDLFLLHTNLFGQAYAPGWDFRKKLIAKLFEGFDALLLTDVNEFEASQQSNKIAKGDNVPYKYVKGSYRPQQMPDEWYPDGLRVPLAVGSPTAPLPVVEKPAVAPAQAPAAAPVAVALTPWGTPVQTIKK